MEAAFLIAVVPKDDRRIETMLTPILSLVVFHIGHNEKPKKKRWFNSSQRFRRP